MLLTLAVAAVADWMHCNSGCPTQFNSARRSRSRSSSVSWRFLDSSFR